MRQDYKNDPVKLQKLLTAIDIELTAIFGPPPPFIPAGLIRDLRTLKNIEGAADKAHDEMEALEKAFKKVDKELLNILSRIKAFKPKCTKPEC